MTVYEAVLEVLVRGGVRHFAGMVGSTTAPYAAALGEIEGTRYIGVRHEQVAAAMMDAVGRLTGTPGCVVTHGATGALAAALGVGAAARDFTPMMLLSGTQERRAMEHRYWQTLDVLRPLAGIAKWQTRVERPEEALGAIERALHATVSGCPGVAQVDLPIDVSLAELPGADAPGGAAGIVAAPLHRPAPTADAVDAVHRLLVEAARPVLVVGVGAWYAGAGAALLRVAERLQAPVITSATARGIVPEDHELSVGPSGILGFEAAGDVLAQADVVIAVGCRLSDMQTARGTQLSREARIVHVDIDAAALGRYEPVHIPIVADAGTFVEALERALEQAPVAVPDERRVWVREASAGVRAWKVAWLDTSPANGRVQPQEVVETLCNELPREAILTHGAGDHAFYGMRVPVSRPGTHLVSAKLGAMGCALGYALGARLVAPRQPVVACVGDGELVLQLGDLETMVREDLSVTVVVFNNFRLGSQRSRVEAFGKPIGVNHGNPDFALLAELFGCAGYRVDEPGQFAEAFDEASRSGPALIDVIVDPDARPPRIAISREAR